MTRELYFLLFNLFTSVGLQNVECGQNQSEHFFFSCAENETRSTLFLFVCCFLFFLFGTGHILITVQLPAVSGQCAL